MNLLESNNHEENFNVIYIKSEKIDSFEDENEANQEQFRNQDNREFMESQETSEQIKLSRTRERKRLFNLNKRMNETLEEKGERRAKARDQKKALRQMKKEELMTEQLELAKERERKRIQERRKNESEEKKEERRAKDRERHKAKRAWMRNVELELLWGKMSQSEESFDAEGKLQGPQLEILKQIQERKAKDRERNAMKRMNETEEQKAERRAKDREQHAEMRRWKKRLANEGDGALLEKITMMKEKDRIRSAEKRKNETEEQKQERKEKDRLRHATRRAWMKNLEVGFMWDKLSHSNESDIPLTPVNTQIPYTPQIVITEEKPNSDIESTSSNTINMRTDLPNSNNVQLQIKQEPLEIKEEELIIEPDLQGQSHVEAKETTLNQEPPNQFEFVSINSLSYC